MRVPGEQTPEPTAGDLGPSERVLESLDALVERDADLGEVLAAVALRTGRSAGARTPDGRWTCADPDGSLRHGSGPVPDTARVLPDGLRVWLDGDAWPDEALVLRRLGVTVKSTLRQQPRVTVPAIEVVLDGARSAEERSRAALQLGLSENAVLTVFGLQGDEDMVATLETRIRRRATRAHGYRVDPRTLIVVAAGMESALAELAVPVGSRSAVTRAVRVADLPAARETVRLGLRYTLPATHDSAPYAMSEAVLLDTSTMGGYALLPAYLTPEQIDSVEDVRLLDHLRRVHGPDMLVILEAVAATDSVRKAARSVHLHHNSVAQRVARAEEVLGFRFVEPYGRTRLFLALCLRRVRDSADG